jgi:thiol-disulfide isomerase/thioredoxin
MKQKTIFFIIIIILVLGISGSVLINAGKKEVGIYDQFALCLKESDAIFYGAFWCSHCNATKKMFGSSAKFLPYVECSTVDPKVQAEICSNKKIEAYPTWEFEDGSRVKGAVSLKTLSEKTGCLLPLIK